VFVLSPASCAGQRANLIFRQPASFELARRLRAPEGAPLGDVFSFLSGLYFRGKLAYALRFARPPAGVPGVLVITPCHGLRPPDVRVSLAVLRRYRQVPIDAADARYRRPVIRDARLLAAALRDDPECDVVLLGSVATTKYTDLLGAVFVDRLVFPIEFVGRGDMSRGGLLLRCVDERRELDYAPVLTAARRGPRPVRLAPAPGIWTREPDR
jgi:hypothetical protein